MRKLVRLLCVALLFVPRPSFASLYPVPFEERIRMSSLIIEGVVESQESFWNPAHTMIFTKSHVRITKRFTDATAAAYVDVLTHGGAVGDETIHASDLLELHTGDAGIFCLYPNTFGLQDPASGALLWDVWASGQGFFRYDAARKSAATPFDFYGSIAEDLYSKITAATGQPFVVVDPSFGLWEEGTGAKTTATISSFSPSTLRAGNLDVEAQNLLTINGSGFSTLDSSSAVLFPNANNGGSTIDVAVGGQHDPRIKSWSDTKIEVRVPTSACTGAFSVRDATNTIVATSASAITVEYAVLDAVFGAGTTASPYAPYEYNLMNANGSGGYTIAYSSNASNGGADFYNAAAKATTSRAFATWKTLAGYNITENGAATSSQIVDADNGENVVMYDNTASTVGVLASGVLATCYSAAGRCSTGAASDGAQLLGFDIKVRSAASTGSVTFTAGPCSPTTAELDLESVMLHEIGHAIGEGHIKDGVQGTLPAGNPAKVMHYAISYGAKRTSPDASALDCATYLVAGAPSHTYPNPTCAGYFTAQMTPQTITLDARDTCPSTFPVTVTDAATPVSFDLAKATSDKSADPQYTAFSTAGTGTGVTNTVFFPIRTRSVSGLLKITVSGYTTPTTQSGCPSTGVELALYTASSCPTGQSFPTPFATRTFSANGALADITGLAASANYLIVMDGVANNAPSFMLSFSGSTALPLDLLSFDGEATAAANRIRWALSDVTKLRSVELERSTNGKDFAAIYAIAAPTVEPDGRFDDKSVPSLAQYRLRMISADGSVQHSRVVTLRREAAGSFTIVGNGFGAAPVIISQSATAQRVYAELTDLLGRRLWSESFGVEAGESRYQPSLPDVASGMYLLRVGTPADGIVTTAKVMR